MKILNNIAKTNVKYHWLVQLGVLEPKIYDSLRASGDLWNAIVLIVTTAAICQDVHQVVF